MTADHKNRQLNFRDERKDTAAHIQSIQQNRQPISILLDGVADIRNIGSIFRIADAANISSLYFYNCPIDPTDRRLRKTGRASQQYVQSKVLLSLQEVIALKSSHHLVALEVTSMSQPYYKVSIPKPSIIAIGNEIRGVSQEILDVVDASVHLPMYGVNTSMNVATAAGIAIYHYLHC